MRTRDRIPVESIRPGESPRFGAEDEEHIRRLAQTDAELPPILVHRSTMRVIDGMHRLGAARLKGEPTIVVEYFDGTEAAAYILGVQANVAHGLPLSLAERKEAARRIVGLQPELADRAVAQLTGLAAGTVGTIRKLAGAEAAQRGSRVGRDGRLRPVNADEGRRRAVEVIREYPDASLREIAQAAGVSLGTAHDIKARLDRGEDPMRRESARGARELTASTAADGVTGEADMAPVPDVVAELAPVAAVLAAMRPIGVPRQGGRGEAAERPDRADPRGRSERSERSARPERPEPFAGLETLRRDPSLRFTDQGRALLIWLHRRLVVVGEAETELRNIPTHLLPVVADLARECSDSWRELSIELQYRARQIG
ncbi:hypothetical protein ABH930_005937 [Kitasatospora sp. GAS204A]|uniref:ParB/RepB/Spo0J family partition protein n=1 Tax=unclassified Kitasatospora TaxID=2633591 RepID=UPI002474349B|nr:ParB/RepB/Spo0J family partition protein [Kitasatospora sp. GAS204B]MDH6121864.1 hypothetical protein [Kitasatospora sp. GAS204B]